ncbi:MAG TPA: LysM domain-containing protein, partial [Rubrivivax sp.]
PPAPAPAPPPPPPPRVDVRASLELARNHLDQGQEELAIVELKRVLQAEPENKTATSFMRQIQDDPKTLYGRVAQSYRVAPGDTLAAIAQRALADRDQFYGLARYNNIKVPRDLKVAQVINVPGTKRVPPPPGSPASAPASAPVPPPSTPSAPAASDEQKAAEAKRVADEKQATAERKAAADRKAAIDRNSRAARSAMARQDVCGAIKSWDAVLALDPDNQTAQLERTRAVGLKARLPASQC